MVGSKSLGKASGSKIVKALEQRKVATTSKLAKPIVSLDKENVAEKNVKPVIKYQLFVYQSTKLVTSKIDTGLKTKKPIKATTTNDPLPKDITNSPAQKGNLHK